MPDMQHTGRLPGILIGRQAELDRIQAVMEAAERGAGESLLLIGNSGSGKTHLAQEAVHQAAGRGMLPLRLACRGGEVRPLDPLSDLARALLDVDVNLAVDEQRAAVRQAAEHLHLDREIAVLFNLLGLPAERAAESQTVVTGPLHDPAQTVVLAGEINAVDAVVTTARRWLVEKTRPLLVIFDDIDQGSESVQQVCVGLGSLASAYGLVVLATSTPDTPPDVAAAFPEELGPLLPLTTDETHAMAENLLGAAALSGDLARLFWEHSGGDPLDVMVLARHLRGMDYFVLDDLTGEASLQGVYTIPGKEDLIVGRARRMPPGQRDTLLAGTVLGSGFRFGALRALRRDAPHADLMRELRALVADGWLDVSGSGRRSVFRFAQRSVEALIYESIPAEARSQMHLRAGDYYAVPATGHRLRPIPALRHYQLARHVERALAVVEMAIDEADPADREKLLWLYRRGAEVAGRDGQFAAAQARLAEKLGDVHAGADDFVGAAVAYEDLAPLDRPPRLAGKLGLMLLVDDPLRAANTLSKLRGSLEPDDDHDLYWRLVAGLGWALALNGDDYRAVRAVRDALARLADYPGLGDARTLLLGMLGMIMHTLGDREDAAQHIESARAGWGARGNEDGVLLMNQVLIDTPTEQLTRLWLHFILPPLLTAATV